MVKQILTSEVIKMQLTQKETELLKDLQDQEKLCVEKYNKHAAAAIDCQLKDLFTKIASVEQGHLNTINQIQSGTVPMLNGGESTQPTFSATYGTEENADKQNDYYLCSDLLTTEKHASHLYDTSTTFKKRSRSTVKCCTTTCRRTVCTRKKELPPL